MFVICTDLIFRLVRLLPAQICGIEAGLVAGNVAVADKAGDMGRGGYFRICFCAVGISVIDALKLRRMLFYKPGGMGQDFIVIEEVTAVQEEDVVAGHMGNCLVHGFVDAVIGFLVEVDASVLAHGLYGAVTAAAVLDDDFHIRIGLGQNAV